MTFCLFLDPWYFLIPGIYGMFAAKMCFMRDALKNDNTSSPLLAELCPGSSIVCRTMSPLCPLIMLRMSIMLGLFLQRPLAPPFLNNRLRGFQ